MLNITKKQFKISIFCFLTTFALSVLICTQAPSNRKAIYQNLVKKDLTFDFSWLQDYGKKYPELHWFSHQKFIGKDIEHDALHFTYKELSKKEYSSFEKLVFMLYHLRLFLDCDLADFHQIALLQDKELQVEFDAFFTIKKEILDCLCYKEGISSKRLKILLELSLIYSMIQESSKAKDMAFIYEIKPTKEDLFFTSILEQQPSFFPTYTSLETNEKKLLLHLIEFKKLDALFCMDYHKNDVSKFKLQHLYARDKNLFTLVFFLYRCYCPSTHIFSTHDSFFYHKRLHCHLDRLKKSFLKMQNSGVRAGFDHYKKEKRSFFAVDETSIIDLVLEPILFKLYFLDKKEAVNLKKSFMNLGPLSLSRAITYLKDDRFSCTCFMTNVLQAMFESNRAKSSTEIFRDSIDIFVKVLGFIEEDATIKDVIHTLDDVQLIKALRLDPDRLMACNISIDQSGTIRVKEG